MSGQQIQPVAPEIPTATGLAPIEWAGDQGAPPAEPRGPSIGRYLAAVKRFKWLVLLMTAVGAAGGYFATTLLIPEYEVQATILLEQGTAVQGQGGGGPIRAQELLQASGWQDLVRSYAIADPVVTELGLFVTPTDRADSTIFRAFRVEQDRLRPGDYRLTITGRTYLLATKGGVEVERGALGDSIGLPIGFMWQPAANQLAKRNEIDFSVQTPREASLQLIKRLGLTLQNGSSFMKLSLTGPDAQRTAATLNVWVEQFVAVATALKKKNVSSVAAILEGQREYAARALQDAEAALESFRVRTVTEPNERATITPGIELTTSPVFDNYFRDKVLADSYQRDREALERILAQQTQGTAITREAVLSVPMVNSDPAADNLRKLLAEQAEREFNLRRLRESYTDEFQKVKDEQSFLSTLRSASIPNALAAYIEQLQLREGKLNATIESSSRDLRGIPARTIEEQRLKRQVEMSATMYQNLNLKAAEAKLADAATVPDVSILDPAVPPLRPTKNTAPVLILGGTIGALFFGLLLAVVLDQLDKRFRYPEQVTDDLGLFVLGVLPVIGSSKRKKSMEQDAQVVEAFRTIRMNVRYAADPTRPLALTITSPGPNDGKSLVSSNIALSFAESGARTLLIDGDIRRGDLAGVFKASNKPGLVEYLDGTALIAEVLQPVQAHPNLTLIAGGARRRKAPELLATPRLSQLINQMAAEFDVVIVDSPPLGAGFDAYALATATGNMALVMRAGVTDRKMALAKMAVVDTLPVRVMGAVLNGINMSGVYQYYSYYQDYAATDVDERELIGDGRGVKKQVLPGATS